METLFRQDSWCNENPSFGFKRCFNLILLKLCFNPNYSQVWGPDTSVADIFDAVETAIHDADLVPQVSIRILDWLLTLSFIRLRAHWPTLNFDYEMSDNSKDLSTLFRDKMQFLWYKIPKPTHLRASSSSSRSTLVFQRRIRDKDKLRQINNKKSRIKDQ